MPDDDLTLPEFNDFIPVDKDDGFTPESLENDLIPDRPVVLSSEPDILRKLQDNPSFSVGGFVVSKLFNHEGGEDRVRVLDTETDEEVVFSLDSLKGVRDEADLKNIFEGES